MVENASKERNLIYGEFLKFCRNWELSNHLIDQALSEEAIEAGDSFSEVEDKELFEKFANTVPKTPATYKFHDISNETSEKASFLETIKRGEKYEPQFVYANTKIPSLDKSARTLAVLKKFREEIGRETPLRRLYTRLSIETSRMVILATLSQSEGFSEASRKLYGKIDKEEENRLRQNVLSFYQERVDFKQPTVNALDMKEIFEKICSGVGLSTKVRIRGKEDMVVRASASSSLISIREDFNLPLSEAVKQIVHESGHVYTQTRGKTHPCRAGGRKTPGSLLIEEGVNIVLEREIYNKVRDQLGLPQGFKSERDTDPQVRALAISLAAEKSFYETFISLKKIGLDNDRAWTVTLRAKRGLPDVSKPGANHKDLSYYLGFRKVQGEMGVVEGKDKVQNLDLLTQGRFSIGEARYLRKMGIKNPNFPLNGFYDAVLQHIQKFIEEMKLKQEVPTLPL